MIADRLGPPPRLAAGNPAVSPATESIVAPLPRARPGPPLPGRPRSSRTTSSASSTTARCGTPPSPRPASGPAKWARRHPRLSSVDGPRRRRRRADRRRWSPATPSGSGGSGRSRPRLAFRQLADAHEAARILLLDPAADPARRDEGIAACRRALERVRRPRLARLAAVAAGPEPAGRRSGPSSATTSASCCCSGPGPWPGRRPGSDPARRSELAPRRPAVERAGRVVLRPGRGPPRPLGPAGGPGATGRRRAPGRQRARAGPPRPPSARRGSTPCCSSTTPTGRRRATPCPRLAEASRQDPQDFALWMNLGQCHALQGRLGEAEDCFTVAIVLRPGPPGPTSTGAGWRSSARSSSQARLDFDQVLRLRPGLASAYVNRALARLGPGGPRRRDRRPDRGPGPRGRRDPDLLHPGRGAGPVGRPRRGRARPRRGPAPDPRRRRELGRPRPGPAPRRPRQGRWPTSRRRCGSTRVAVGPAEQGHRPLGAPRPRGGGDRGRSTGPSRSTPTTSPPGWAGASCSPGSAAGRRRTATPRSRGAATPRPTRPIASPASTP